MEATSSLFKVVRTLSVEESKLLVYSSEGAILPEVGKGVQVFGSLLLTPESDAIVRRLPFDTVNNRLADWQERISIIFYRFLYGKSFHLSYTDANGVRFSLDSDEKMEFFFQPHHIPAESQDNPTSPFIVIVEPDLDENEASADTQTNVHEPMECDSCTESLALGAGFKCLNCRCVQICETCEMCGHHFGHLLIPFSFLFPSVFKQN